MTSTRVACCRLRSGSALVRLDDDEYIHLRSMRIQIPMFLLLTTLVIPAALYTQQSAAAQGRERVQTAVTPASPKPEDTEVWEPVPKVVTPAADCNAPASDAIILFDGKNLDEWVSAKDRSPARWTVSGGVVTVNKAAGDIETKRTFRNYQLHLEWKTPENITGSGQARGNSGVFLASTGRDGYELQILDSYNNRTYVNGQAASIYKQGIPLVNPSRRPGEWQTYDVVWTAPIFHADGSLRSSAYVTVLFNGVLVQNHFELKGETRYIGQPSYKEYEAAPIRLQAHGDPSEPISFRNIWLRELN
jgi:3-keto-disaccharide hydrolase